MAAFQTVTIRLGGYSEIELDREMEELYTMDIHTYMDKMGYTRYTEITESVKKYLGLDDSIIQELTLWRETCKDKSKEQVPMPTLLPRMKWIPKTHDTFYPDLYSKSIWDYMERMDYADYFEIPESDYPYLGINYEIVNKLIAWDDEENGDEVPFPTMLPRIPYVSPC